MNVARHINTRNILLVILVHALVLKLTGLSYGLPHTFRSDEESMIGGALRMIQFKTLIPALHPNMEILNYPPYLAYIYMMLIVPILGVLFVISGFPDLLTFKVIVFEHMDAIFLAARSTSVLFSLGTIWLTYKIAALLFRNPSVALFAALLQSIDFVSNFTAHFARHWNATTFAIWLAIYFAIHIAQTPSRKNYLLAGFASGFGFGISYSFGSLGIFAAGVAHIYRVLIKDKSLKRLIDRNLFYMVGAFLFLACLSLALHPNAFLRLLGGDVGALDATKSFAEWFASIIYYFQGLIYFNPVLALLAAAAVPLLIVQRQFEALMWGLGLGLFYITVMYATVPLESRYIIAIIPLFAIGGGYVLAWFLDQASSPRSKIAFSGIIFVFLSYSFTTTWYEHILLQRDDTREQAISWIENKLPEDARIVFILGGSILRPTHAALLDQKELDPASLNAWSRALLEYYQTRSAPIESVVGGRTYHAIHPLRFNEPVLTASREGQFLDRWMEDGYEYYAIQFRGDLYDSELSKRIRVQGERLAIFRPARSGDALPTYLHSSDLLSKPVSSIFQFERFGPIVELYRIAQP